MMKIDKYFIDFIEFIDLKSIDHISKNIQIPMTGWRVNLQKLTVI